MSRRSRHRDGQASVEYAVIVAFIAIIASAASGYLQNQTNALFIPGSDVRSPNLKGEEPGGLCTPCDGGCHRDGHADADPDGNLDTKVDLPELLHFAQTRRLPAGEDVARA